MRKLFAVAIGVTCALSSMTASAGDVAATNAVAPAERENSARKARDLLDLIASPDEAQRNFVTNYLAAYDALFERDAAIRNLETRKPGLITAIRARILAEIETLAAVETKRSSDAVAEIYQRALTEDDLDTAISFYRSPMGVRMSRKMIAAAEQEYRKSGDKVAALDANGVVRDMTKSATVAAFEAIGPEDGTAVATFMRSPAYLKMQMVSPEVQQVVTRALLASQERVEAKMTPIITQAISNFSGR